MKYKLPVIIVQSEEGGYIARCEEVRATATGDNPDEAVDNLREAIKEMITEFGGMNSSSFLRNFLSGALLNSETTNGSV